MGRKNRRIEERLSKLPTVEELRRESKRSIIDGRSNKSRKALDSKYGNNQSQRNTSNQRNTYSQSNIFNQNTLEKSNRISAVKNDFSTKADLVVMGKSTSSSGKSENTYHDKDTPVLRGSIWLASLETHIGTSVQGGFRPVIVVSNDVCNKFSKTVTVVPLTSIIKRMKIPTHVLIPVTDEMKLVKPTMVMAEQVMTIDKTSLKKYLSRINDRQLMDRIDNAIRVQLML